MKMDLRRRKLGKARSCCAALDAVKSAYDRNVPNLSVEYLFAIVSGTRLPGSFTAKVVWYVR